MNKLISLFTLIGNSSSFGLRALASAFVPPFEWQYFLIQVEATGFQSLPLIAAAQFLWIPRYPPVSS